MSEKNSIQWFGIKSEGLIAILLGVGVFLHYENTLFPMGEIAIGAGIILIIVDVVITIQDKYWESKRRWYR